MDLRKIWTEHQRTTFPPTALGMQIDGLPLVKLDALAGAALTASLRDDGVPRPLPEARQSDLRRAVELAVRARSQLPLDAATRAYLETLICLAGAVLERCRRTGGPT